jgi:hypothetical protein
MTSEGPWGSFRRMARQVEVARDRIRGLFGFSEEVATRVVSEVFDCIQMSADEFIVRRHEELKRQGLGNDAIYEQIACELKEERFVGSAHTARQIRRRIYG